MPPTTELLTVITFDEEARIEMSLPSLNDQRARQLQAYRQVEDHILATEITPRVTAEVIAEHAASPVGKHSDDLERILVYLRKHHLAMEGKYILVCTKPHQEWRIATVTGQISPDQSPQLSEERFPDRFAAEHGIFLRRLTDAGLLTTHDGMSA